MTDKLVRCPITEMEKMPYSVEWGALAYRVVKCLQGNREIPEHVLAIETGEVALAIGLDSHDEDVFFLEEYVEALEREFLKGNDEAGDLMGELIRSTVGVTS